MRYFAYIADQSFKTDADGNVSFFLHGPFSRPLVVPSTEDKERLHKKLTWFYRVFLGGLIVGMILFQALVLRPASFFSLLVGAVVLQYIVLQLLFRDDLRVMKRSDTRFGLERFYAGMAAQHSLTKLVLGFIAALLSAFGGLFMRHEGMSPWFTGFSIVLFGLCAVAWGYALIVKMATTNGDPSARANGASPRR